jgi:hypothetical protein
MRRSRSVCIPGGDWRRASEAGLAAHNMTVRLQCEQCGAFILLATAEKTGGLCMPCKKGIRDKVDAAKLWNVVRRPPPLCAERPACCPVCQTAIIPKPGLRGMWSGVGPSFGGPVFGAVCGKCSRRLSAFAHDGDAEEELVWETDGPPQALTIDFYRCHARIEDVDDGMWTYLFALIPKDPRSYRVRAADMLAGVSPQLKRYFLVRGFDWVSRSEGLEGCFLRDPDHDRLFWEDTIKAFEALGAFKRVSTLRELIPKARDRWVRIKAAVVEGKEFDYGDGFWAPYEAMWDAAEDDLDFYEVIWHDIRTHPERYTHSR